MISSSRTAETSTDASGNFIVLSPPTGLVALHVDGSTATGGNFASLELAITVAGGTSNLAQPIVLPDLDDGTTTSVAVDVNGMTAGATKITAPDGSSIDIHDMTTILLGGQVPAGPVDVNITPVAPIDVPMMLPGTQDPGAFVTIQPPNASFDPPLDITLPNTRGLPLGTTVDVWSFDHDDGAWVNRSQQTGNQGTVVAVGPETVVFAPGVITEGGWHAATVPVDPACATTLEGQVFPLGSSTPLPDVLISLSTGQFARTDAAGRFRIPSVPAYDPAQLPTCATIDVDLRAIAPVSFGAMTLSGIVASVSIVPGGTTVLPPFDIPVTSTGSLVGSVTQAGQGAAGTVSITGPTSLDVESDSFGSFFVASLDPGSYTASFTFPSGLEVEPFTIAANRTTVVRLDADAPPGGGPLTVQVLDLSDVADPQPVPGACVTLQGASAAPQFLVADASGTVTFASTPAGPYTVTGQFEVVTPNFTGRLASTVVGADPVGAPRTVVVPFFDLSFDAPPTVDACLQVVLANIPIGSDVFYQVDTQSGGGFSAGGQVLGDNFLVDIPSGVPLDAAVWSADPATGVVESLLLTSVTASVGESVVRNLDFANACAFDQVVPVTYGNVQAHTSFFAELELQDAGSLSLPFSDGQAFPQSVALPDLSNAKLAPFDVFFSFGSEDSGATFEQSSCDLFLGHTTPASIAVDFLGAPTLQAPANNAAFTTYGTGNTVRFTLGSGNGTASGFNDVTFLGNSELQNLFLVWNLFLPPTQTAVVLPPVFAGKPMFPDGFYAVDVQATRFPLAGFDYATLFDADLPSKAAAVIASEVCSGDTGHFFTVGPVLARDPDARSRLEQRLQRRSALR